MFRTMFSSDIFAEIDRLQREMQQAFNMVPSIRGIGRGSFPALNLGRTPQSVELYAFLPGMDPNGIEVNMERGVLSITGERRDNLPNKDDTMSLHVNERFAGRFRRVLSLPDDLDSNSVTANYRDGVLHVSIKRQEATQPHRISVQ